jgi:hypothetical protein
MKILTVGADPELFLKIKGTDMPISAIGMIGGDKYNPRQITEKGHALQEDNVMVEYCIPPSKTVEEFKHNHTFMLNVIEQEISEEFELNIIPSAKFPEQMLAHPQAQVFGCEPDLNVWTGRENKSPNSKTNLRTAGGHIHCGLEDFTPEDVSKAVKAMDLFLGVPSIIMDTDRDRRKMYGKAGAFREKEYGFEYRTLSNFWIVSEDLMGWAFNNTHKAIEFANKSEISEELASKIQKCINKSDVELAKEIVAEFNIPIMEPLTVVKTVTAE